LIAKNYDALGATAAAAAAVMWIEKEKEKENLCLIEIKQKCQNVFRNKEFVAY
jgi:hypothetical protein